MSKAITTWQDIHTLQYSNTYHCEHFVIDAYRFLLGIDVSGYFLSGQFACAHTLKNFSKLDTPCQHCFVLCRDKNKAHIGIWLDNQVLHLGHRGVVLQPLFVLQQQFERMGFYVLKANDEQYNLAVLD